MFLRLAGVCAVLIFPLGCETTAPTESAAWDWTGPLTYMIKVHHPEMGPYSESYTFHEEAGEIVCITRNKHRDEPISPPAENAAALHTKLDQLDWDSPRPPFYRESSKEDMTYHGTLITLTRADSESYTTMVVYYEYSSVVQDLLRETDIPHLTPKEKNPAAALRPQPMPADL